MEEIDYDKMIEQISEIQTSYEHMVAVNQVLRDAIVVIGGFAEPRTRVATPLEIERIREVRDVVIDRAEDGTITVTIKEKE